MEDSLGMQLELSNKELKRDTLYESSGFIGLGTAFSGTGMYLLNRGINQVKKGGTSLKWGIINSSIGGILSINGIGLLISGLIGFETGINC